MGPKRTERPDEGSPMANVRAEKAQCTRTEYTLAMWSRDESVVSGGHLVAAALKNNYARSIVNI